MAVLSFFSCGGDEPVRYELSRFLSVCALTLRDNCSTCQGLLAARMSLDVVCIPSTYFIYAQFWCACVCPNHSNSSTGLQQQQQQQCSFTSAVPSPGTAAGKPCSCCCGGQDVSHSSSNTVDTTLSGNIMQFLFFILIDKLSLHSRRDWSKE